MELPSRCKYTPVLIGKSAQVKSQKVRIPGLDRHSKFGFAPYPPDAGELVDGDRDEAPHTAPIGFQISGAHFAEQRVLALAHAYEQATDWHKRRPNTLD